MSSIYNTEPQPTASVILHTNYGELSVELFAKQTPLTSRNFLQHCLDGYYDNTIFHRLVPGFILQGGDPTGTGNGGESIYDGGAFAGDLDPWPMDERRGKNAGPMGINFKDEFHSRLKFNRRGLLGMANESAPDTNGSQFFFTLGKTEELNGKNTVFGRVVGDTIYNLAKMGEAEVDETSERPVYALKLERVEILVNPFNDMKQRQRVAPRTAPAPATSKKPKKRKVGKQLLSFGDEEADGDDLPVLKKPKFDARIVMDAENEESELKHKTTKPAKKKEGKAPKPSPAANAVSPTPETQKSANEGREDPRRSPPAAERIHPKFDKRASPERESPEADAPRNKTALEKANEEIAALKASLRRTINPEPVKEEKKSDLDLMIPEKSTRGRKRKPGGGISESAEEQRTMQLLKAFQSKLDHVPATSKGADQSAPSDEKVGNVDGQDVDKGGLGADEGEVCDLHFIVDCQSCKAWDKLENKDESDDEGWMSHTLNFAADRLGKDLTFRKQAEDDLIVIDPREKAHNLQHDRRAEKEARPGASGRARDQARNAQLARASALAGRGAK